MTELAGTSVAPVGAEGDEVTTEAVLAEVRDAIVAVVGEDFLFDTEITMDTSFNEDLELESIEFVALSERLMDHYGERVDFVSWIGGMELDEIVNLTVGQLVDHIASSLR